MSTPYSEFRPPLWLPGGHLQTLVPRYIRRLSMAGEPVEIATPDGDCLYADLYPGVSIEAPLLILSHGLEGSARSGYILGMARLALSRGWSVLAWNLRSCGPRLNKTPAIYHSGCSEDLEAVIRWGRAAGWSRLLLGGFSLGGNVTLKWLGERGESARDYGVLAAATASVPIDLLACVRTLERPINWVYHKHFVRSMKRRLRAKAEQFPEHYDLEQLRRMATLWELDEHYTAPLNGFRDAADYYSQCSGRYFLDDIRLSTLLVTAGNDPFFDASCYPFEQARANDQLHFEAPAGGGHVGFWGGPGHWWLEQRFMQHLAGALE